ncbi:hypothetical protein BGZ74_010947 [Mortierella antarctica]|nr:hypothetical protein BGZ74_010947 [Mortierella antarctica]
MTDNKLTFFCVIDGESTPFPVEIEPTKTIGELKKTIKDDNAVAFVDVDAKMLTLWGVSIPVAPKKERKDISLAGITSKEELDETDDVSDVFKETPPRKQFTSLSSDHLQRLRNVMQDYKELHPMNVLDLVAKETG